MSANTFELGNVDCT